MHGVRTAAGVSSPRSAGADLQGAARGSLHRRDCLDLPGRESHEKDGYCAKDNAAHTARGQAVYVIGRLSGVRVLDVGSDRSADADTLPRTFGIAAGTEQGPANRPCPG